MGPIRFEVGGLKCDQPRCDWKDMTIPRSAYKSWLHKGCPKCGASVLTAADMRATRLTEFGVAAINLALFWMKSPKDSDPHFRTEVNMNGTGIISAVTKKVN